MKSKQPIDLEDIFLTGIVSYPAHFQFEPEVGGYTVTFRDIPSAVTQGDDKEEAEAMAKDALITAMEMMIEEGQEIPTPSALQPEEELIDLDNSEVLAKVALHNHICRGSVTLADVVFEYPRPGELLKLLSVKPDRNTGLLAIWHNSVKKPS